MSRRIYRYALSEGVSEIKMPKGAKILHAGFQSARKEFSVWAAVEPDKKLETRWFHVYPTGVLLPAEKHMRFIASTILPDGFHVFHIFEELDQ